MKQKNQERLIALGLFALLLILMVPLLLIARYNVMGVDDYTYINIAQNGLYEGQGLLSILIAQMKNAYDCWSTWQGQYFVNWLIMVFLALGGAEHYYLVIAVTLIPLLLAELFLAYVVLHKGFHATFAQVCIVVIPVMIFHMSIPSSLVEAYYWLSGAITYTTTYAISLVSIALLTNLLFVQKESRGKVIASEIVLILLSVCLGGSNFVTGLFQLLVFCLFAAYGIFAKQKHRVFYIINLAVFVVCFLITVFSPGATNRRQENAEAQVSAIKAIVLSLYKAAEYIRSWTLPFVILLMVAMIPIFWKLVKKKSYRFPLPLLVLLVSFGMYAAQFTPNQYALGILGAYRVQNIYRFQMLLWLLGNEFYILGYLHRRFPDLKIPFADKVAKIPFVSLIYSGFAVIVVLFCMRYYAGNTLSSVSAYRDLRDGSAAIYYQEYEKRLEILNDSSVQDAVLEPYSRTPYALFFNDLKTFNGWENMEAAKYYGKNSILLQKTE